ncbi:MAG: hypothetical protein ABJE47_15585 [bacterium]
MATFDARQKELYERFTGIQGDLRFDHVTAFIFALQEHARQRDEALRTLADLAASHDESPKHPDFASKLDALSRSVVSVLNNMLDHVDQPSLKAMKYRDQAVVEEARFWATLKALAPAADRDEQMVRSHNLEFSALVLRSKWDNLSGTEKVLLEKERYYAEQMRQALKAAMEESVAAYMQAARAVVDFSSGVDQLKSQINNHFSEFVRTLAEKQKVDATIPEYIASQLKPGSQLATGLFLIIGKLSIPVAAAAKGVNALASLMRPYVERAYATAAAEMQRTQIGSLQVGFEFSETRKQADEYLRTSGWDGAKEQYAASHAAIDRWSGDQMTSALSAEAEAFGKMADIGPAFWLEMTRIHHESLLRDFGGIFFGDLSSAARDQLSNERFLIDWKSSLDSQDFDGKLRDLRDQVQRLSGDVEVAFGRIDTFSDLPFEARALIQGQVNDAKDGITRPLTVEMQEALRAMDSVRERPVKDKTMEIIESMNKQRESLARH